MKTGDHMEQVESLTSYQDFYIILWVLHHP